MAKQRALIGRNMLERIVSDYARGVPITTLRHRYGLSLHYSTLKNLIDTCLLVNIEQDKQAEASLYPDWLSPDVPVIYAPAEYTYAGEWPTGQWDATEYTGKVNK